LKQNTTKGYGTLKHHLSKFSDKRKYDITFQSINNLFYGKYLAFLEDEFNLGPNSIGKDIKNIKSVMNQGLDEELHHNRAFQNKSFTKPKEKTSAVYLTMDELDHFYHFDLSGNKVENPLNVTTLIQSKLTTPIRSKLTRQIRFKLTTP
jgi:hypothetical protein